MTNPSSGSLTWQGQHKLGCANTEDGYGLEISNLERGGIVYVLTKALISCAVTTIEIYNEPRHEKTNILHMRKKKTQISFAAVASSQ